MTAPPRRSRTVVGSAMGITVLCASVGYGVGGVQTAASALNGAAIGAVIQVAAYLLLVRNRDAGLVHFLAAFLRASFVRLFGGAVLVWLFLALGAAEAYPFLAGFGVSYVGLEIVTGLEFVRMSGNEDRSGPTG